MGTKGKQSKKGQGELYHSPKDRITISLTPETIRMLTAEVDRLKSEGISISRSELIEILVRHQLNVQGVRWGSSSKVSD